MPGPHPTHVSIPSFKMATGKKDRLQMIYEKDGRNTSSSDPEMMESRIFIGNLIKKVTRQQVEEKFTKYGKVLGVSLHKSYGFIQFETKESAQNAVNAENGNSLNGNKMDICIATKRRKEMQSESSGSGGSRRRRPRSRSPLFSHRHYSSSNSRDHDFLGRYSRLSPPPPRLRGPLIDPYRDPYVSVRDSYLYPHDDLYDRYPPPRDYYDYPPPPLHMEREYRSPPPFISDYPLSRRERERYERGDYSFHREREGLLPPPTFSRREERDPYKGPSSSSIGATIGERRVAAEVQVIIVNAQQKEYAQRVRERVEGLGLVVESLHLSPTVSLSEALDNAARQGLLYTIIITNQHEAHRSVTLTILHGRNPQEHKNMPLDDAIALIDRDYERYCQSRGISSGSGLGVGGASDRVSDLMAKAASGRDLSSSELSTLISSLQQKQQQQSRGYGSIDNREAALSSLVSNDDIKQQQADLQAKILQLLGSNAVVPSSSSTAGGSSYRGGDHSSGGSGYGSRKVGGAAGGGSFNNDSFHSVKGFGGYR